MARHRVLYICDWLPPEFGAVGQYSLRFARQRAGEGQDVVLTGLSSSQSSTETEEFEKGRLTILRLKARAYDRSRFLRRMAWTASTNVRLLWRLRRHLRQADEILFTGSPPFMLHFIVPLNVLLRKQLVYRITDFHPECLMASMDRVPWWLNLFYRLTVWRRKAVHKFEVLGKDQRRRLLEIGIPAERITIKRDDSPVEFPPTLTPLPRPEPLAGYKVLLYSGNFGVAHDHETFIEGYRRHHCEGSGRVALWLNATGAKADVVEREIRKLGLPIHRTRPVPLEDLPRLLITPDAHLITLRDPFVGFVMPSKVYACLESGPPVLYIGSVDSDIHWLSRERFPDGAYLQAGAGDSAGVAECLETLARQNAPVSLNESSII